MGADFERACDRLRTAISLHEQGDLDHAGLQAAVDELLGTIAVGQRGPLRHALFEADVTLEYARDGHPAQAGESRALRRMRRNLREALR